MSTPVILHLECFDRSAPLITASIHLVQESPIDTNDDSHDPTYVLDSSPFMGLAVDNKTQMQILDILESMDSSHLVIPLIDNKLKPLTPCH